MPALDLKIQTKFTFEGGQFVIRPAGLAEQEALRNWKNQNQKAFSYREKITAEMQLKWFREFGQSANQEMFVCFQDQEPIACVGFRQSHATDLKRPMRQDEVELFNLICGIEKFRGRGLIREFYQSLEQRLLERNVRVIYLRVLKTNRPAIQWYEKQGFKKYEENEECLFMERELV